MSTASFKRVCLSQLTVLAGKRKIRNRPNCLLVWSPKEYGDCLDICLGDPKLYADIE